VGWNRLIIINLTHGDQISISIECHVDLAGGLYPKPYVEVLLDVQEVDVATLSIP
jgi:hypothetical protein